MSRPTLSIVTPSYNQAEFIEDNLRSVRNQADDSVEHVVVDGSSEDRTVELLKRYERDYRLRWVSEPDRGQSHAINKGIRMAEGAWIGWQNADDYYLPGAFEAFDRVRRDNPSVDVIYGDQVFVDANGTWIDRRYHTRPSKFIQKHWQHVFANSSLFVRTPVLDDVGRIDPAFEYTMDADLFWRLLRSDLRFAHVSEFIGVRRMHEAAKTSGKDPQQYQWELHNLYRYSPVEQVLPEGLLKTLAVVLKAFYLITDRRWDGLRHLCTRLAYG